MSRASDWGRAFADQAKADLDACDELEKCATLPECQKLHFLQMACEKLGKAHLCLAGADPIGLQTSHKYIAKILPIIAKEQYARVTGKRVREHHWPIHLFRQLAREIELLSPAVDDAMRRPDNCEYPWQDAGGEICIPAKHQFTNLHLLTRTAGRTLLKLVRLAISELVYLGP